MKARIILNEIAKGGAGWGTLGVGHAEVLKTYIKLNKKWPEWFNEDRYTLKEVFDNAMNAASSEKIKTRLLYYKEVFEEYSDNPMENFICVNIGTTSGTPYFQYTDEMAFDMGFDFDNFYEIFNEEFDNGRKVIFSSKFDYMYKQGIGVTYLNVCEKTDNIFHFIFVKNK
jgi:hypothetical protein